LSQVPLSGSTSSDACAFSVIQLRNKIRVAPTKKLPTDFKASKKDLAALPTENERGLDLAADLLWIPRWDEPSVARHFKKTGSLRIQGIRQTIAVGQSTVLTLEVRPAYDEDGFFGRPLVRPPNKGGNGCRHPGDCMYDAGKFFDYKHPDKLDLEASTLLHFAEFALYYLPWNLGRLRTTASEPFSFLQNLRHSWQLC
jgi:hypothetical protein